MRPRKALAGIDAGTTRLLAALMRKPPSWAVRLYRSSPIESERAATIGRLEEDGVTRQILIVPGTAKYDSQLQAARSLPSLSQMEPTRRPITGGRRCHQMTETMPHDPAQRVKTWKCLRSRV